MNFRNLGPELGYLFLARRDAILIALDFVSFRNSRLIAARNQSINPKSFLEIMKIYRSRKMLKNQRLTDFPRRPIFC